MKTITTERLLLRPPRREDLPSLAEGIGEWDVARMLGRAPYPYALADAEGWFEKITAGSGTGLCEIFCILLKDNAAESVIGVIGIEPKTEGGPPEIGYWIAKPHWNRGYAGEAVAAMLAFGFEVLDLPFIGAAYYIENPASGRVLARAGFKDVAEETRWCEARGAHVDAVRLELTREMFEARRDEGRKSVAAR